MYRLKHSLLAGLFSALLLAALPAGADNDTNTRQSSPAPQNMPPQQRMLPMPPPGYYPPTYAHPYYRPPVWGYRSPFDDPWFRRFDNRDPFADIQRMQWEMERFIDETFRRFGVDRSWHNMDGVITPGLDLRDEGDHYVAVVDIPGADKDAINIELNDRTLRISAQQHQENKRTDDKGNVIFQERRSGMFQRMVTLPEPVSASGMKSDYKDGVLTITIPKQNG